MKKLLNVILLLLVILGICWYVSQNWDFQVFETIRFNPFYLTGASLMLMPHFFLVCLLSHKLLTIRTPMRYRDYLDIYFVSQLGRYIPGKIWMVVGKFEALRRRNYSVPWITFASFHEMLLMMIGAGFLVMVGLPFIEIALLDENPMLKIPIIVIPILSILIIAPFFRWLFAFLSKRFSRLSKLSEIDYPFSRMTLSWITGGYVLSWIFQGIGFFWLIRSIFPMTDFSLLFILCYPAAWIVGFLAIFSPSGIGVRESILILLLSTRVSASEAALIAIAARIWATSIEFIAAFLAVMIGNFLVTDPKPSKVD